MHRQVGGALVWGDDGLVKRGLIICHLILPNDLAGSEESLRWVCETLGKDVTLSVMAQYYPTYQATEVELLNRKIYAGEYRRVLRLLGRLEMNNGWAQEWEKASEYYRPEFQDRSTPFKGGVDNEPEQCPTTINAHACGTSDFYHDHEKESTYAAFVV